MILQKAAAAGGEPPSSFCYDSGMSVAAVIGEKQGVFFDLFHTLVSASVFPGRPTHEILGVKKSEWRQQTFAASHSRLTRSDLDPYQIIRSMARAIDPKIPESLIREATDQRAVRFEETLKNPPETTLMVLEALRKHGIATALITNADAIETSGWPSSPLSKLFDCTVFSWEVGYAKPDRKIYEHCLSQMGLESKEAAFVGDGGADELSGARAVGLTVVFAKGLMPELAPSETAKRERTAHYAIESLSELVP
jgi:putative hydrolase of the HAD superfamily